MRSRAGDHRSSEQRRANSVSGGSPCARGRSIATDAADAEGRGASIVAATASAAVGAPIEAGGLAPEVGSRGVM